MPLTRSRARLLPALLLVAALGLLLPIRTSSLTVHLVPHTHDDVGWLSTVDQYYIDHVQHILTSVVAGLRRVPERKFVYVEQAYFQRWWAEQNDDIRAATRRLVHNGQLSFANGGWCMHDEATTHYVDMIDQTTLGHQYILNEFGPEANPTVGFQLDPFGHSATQASLLSAGIGFNALFFGRIDYQDHDLRVASKDLQFVWAPSQSQGLAQSVYTEASLDGNYNPPDGLCWDPLCSPFSGGPSPAVQDRDDLYDKNVDAFVALFIQRAYEMAAVHKGDLATMNIMWLMGSDFMYEGAETWFINLDRIIKAVNRNGTVHTRYSTPAEYVEAKLKEGVQRAVKTDDFFPYMSDPQNTWVGFYSTRPGLKGYVRSSSILLQTARQIETLSAGDGSGTARLWEALSLAQHHDGITGTELDWVADDYAMRIASGATEAYSFVDAAISRMTGATYQSCALLNISVCEVLRTASKPAYSVVFYNPQPRNVSTVVQIPIFGPSVPQSVVVTDSAGTEVVSDAYPLPVTSDLLNTSAIAAVSFAVNATGLSYSAYSVTPTFATPPRTRHAQHAGNLLVPAPPASDSVSIENEAVRLDFDVSTGLLASWTDKASGVQHALSQQFFYYESSNTSSAGCSNNYHFRPQPGTGLRVLSPAIPQLTVLKGRTVQTVFQRWTDWLSQTVRLYSNPADDVQGSVVEIDWTVGPVNIDDGRSKEVVTKYTTDIASAGVLYTDSNGREYQRRVKDQRPTWNWTNVSPVAGNYYPLSTGAWLAGEQSALGVLVDRAEGAASLQDGVLEVMLHRRVLYSCFGFNLNETGADGRGLVISGTHRLVLSSGSSGSSRDAFITRMRVQQQRAYAPLYPVFGPLSSSLPAPSARIVGVDLAPNVELMTLQQLNASTTLLRLQHSFAANESATWSRTAHVDLSTLFATRIAAVQEVSLTGNRRLGATGTRVALEPMEVRAFFINFER